MKHRRLLRDGSSDSGFSLVEVLIAGIILFVLVQSANRALLVGMAGTSQSGSRTSLEAEIFNDIESIQAIDSSLSGDISGCGASGGSSYLANKVETLNPASTTHSWTRQLDYSDPTILTITYSFSMPENTTLTSNVTNNASPTGIEKRLVEINPSFLTECPIK